MNKIEISTVTDKHLNDIVPYVIACRKQLFPMLDPTIIPTDLVAFEQNYIQSETSLFLQARTSDAKLVGAIGMMPYNYRFEDLPLAGTQIVEVARLFVDQAYRRNGLATLLYQQLEQEAKAKGVDEMYLHTHPFLEGAYTFWTKQGFSLLRARDESGFATLHLHKPI